MKSLLLLKKFKSVFIVKKKLILVCQNIKSVLRDVKKSGF